MFITLEGIEGSGKTTQLKHIVEFLKERKHQCIVTREPGGTEIGKKIRAILLDPDNKDLDPLSELLLYAADRAQHIQSTVKRCLAEGKTVICDRFCDSTTVYQGYARGLDMKLIDQLNNIVLDSLKPDITFIFDLEPETGLFRAQKQLQSGSRDDSETRFEEEALSFHKKVRNGFLELARIEPERFRVIDASKNENQVKDKIIEILSSDFGV